MVQLNPTEISMAQNVSLRRSDDRVPLLSNNGRFREPPLRHLWLGLQRSSWFLIAFLAVFITYLSLGALVFSSMEQPLNRHYRLDIRNRVEKFLFKYPLIPGLKHPFNDSHDSQDFSSSFYLCIFSSSVLPWGGNQIFPICLGKKNYTYGLEDKLFKVDHEKERP
jgi:hypothetical protein